MAKFFVELGFAAGHSKKRAAFGEVAHGRVTCAIHLTRGAIGSIRTSPRTPGTRQVIDLDVAYLPMLVTSRAAALEGQTSREAAAAGPSRMRNDAVRPNAYMSQDIDLQFYAAILPLRPGLLRRSPIPREASAWRSRWRRR
jgi:hypothetical protein